jgi:hypothetical protein
MVFLNLSIHIISYYLNVSYVSSSTAMTETFLGHEPFRSNFRVCNHAD